MIIDPTVARFLLRSEPPHNLRSWSQRRSHGRLVHATKPNPYTVRRRNRAANKTAAASRRRNR